MPDNGDPLLVRVDPAEHRGRDVGVLHRSFRLPADRRDDDPRGPRPIVEAIRRRRANRDERPS
jgi:hypothetical protein